MAIKGNVIANYLGEIWSILLSFCLVPIYIHYLGAEAYGLIGFYISLQAVLGVLDLGLSTTANREIARKRGRLVGNVELRGFIRTYEVVYLTFGVVIAVAVVSCANYITHDWINIDTLSAEDVYYCIAIVGATIGLRWPTALYRGVLLGLERQWLFNAMRITITSVSGLVSIVMVIYITTDILAFFGLQLVIGFVELLGFVFSIRIVLPDKSVRPQFHIKYLLDNWRYSAGVSLISILAVIIKQADKIVVSKMLPLDKLGYYTAATVIASGLSRLIGPVTQAVFPRLSALIEEGNDLEVEKTYHLSSQLISFLISPIAAILIFYSSNILLLWSGSDALAGEASFVLSLFAISTLFNSMMQLPYCIQLSAGITKLSIYNNFIALIFTLPLTILLTNNYGLVGAAAPWAIYNVLYYLITPNYIHKYILKNAKRNWYLRDTLPYIALSLLVYGGIACGYKVNIYSWWLIKVFVSTVIYLAIVAYINKGLFNYIKASLSLLKRRRSTVA